MNTFPCNPPCQGTMGPDPESPGAPIPHRFFNEQLEMLLTCSRCGRQEWMKDPVLH